MLLDIWHSNIVPFFVVEEVHQECSVGQYVLGGKAESFSKLAREEVLIGPQEARKEGEGQTSGEAHGEQQPSATRETSKKCSECPHKAQGPEASGKSLTILLGWC